ncbi:sensor histidine kinase [Streptomyces sp. NPDC059070]|uniref:sensor histidine kinase n=1 Tax=Streptomyces sp. NPDC059070 TaxID=3346713 RepID=UPI0036BFE562
MIRGIRPLLSGSTYSGALFAFGGALLSLPLLPFAMLPALAVPSAHQEIRAFLALLVWTGLIGAIGFARTARRALTAAARRSLRVALPAPARSGGADRRRTPLWLLLHVALGWVLSLAGGVLLLAGLTLPVPWFRTEAGLSLFGGTVRAEGAGQRWAVALGCLLLAAALCAVVTGALRWLAPRLLGPSSAERLALAAERELRLAERNRLAQELHDSIGHTLTAATIQAAVAGEVLVADPTAARAALRGIEESARAALEDLDYVLGVLREEETAVAPTRTLADLPELTERLRLAGAVVEQQVSGDLAQVPGTLSRAAYRIVQEGLTNALRHGADGPIGLRVAAVPDGLEVEVVNRTGDGTGPRAFPESGRGLSGLAERVRLLHGEMEAGPAGPRQWRLAVRLPVRWSA